MCVIAINEKGVVPEHEALLQMQNSNPDGIGLAWVNRGSVIYRRGISLDNAEEQLARIKSMGCPYILHFRITTKGGEGPQYCHPWPVSHDVGKLFSTSGRADAVLAHNGTWREYEQFLAPQKQLMSLKQHWSDTTAMAWLVGQDKSDAGLVQILTDLEIRKVEQKVVLLNKKGEFELFGSWETDDAGIQYSNMFWEWSHWDSWYDNSYAGHFAAEPTYTICDLESLRRGNRISKRKYRKLRRLLLNYDRTDHCDSDETSCSLDGKILKSHSVVVDKYCRECGSWDCLYPGIHSNVIQPSTYDLKPSQPAKTWSDYSGVASKSIVFCEDCGYKFSSACARCPMCSKGEGVYSYDKNSLTYTSMACGLGYGGQHPTGDHQHCNRAWMCACDCHMHADSQRLMRIYAKGAFAETLKPQTRQHVDTANSTDKYITDKSFACGDGKHQDCHWPVGHCKCNCHGGN